MDGTEHQGLMLVMNSPAVPDQEADWNRWHDEEHRPAILGSGFFTAANRFEVFGKAQAPSETRYLSLYQTPRADADQAQVDMAKANAAHRAEPRPPSVRALIGTYTKLSEFGAPDRPRAGSIVLVMTDCVDPAAEAYFNKWYDEVHVHEVMAHRQHSGCARYAAINPKPWQAKYLVVYENPNDDAGQSRGPIPPTLSATPKALRLWCNIPYRRLT